MEGCREGRKSVGGIGKGREDGWMDGWRREGGREGERG